MIDHCWSTIGVRGDGSCPELKQYAHCRNCVVYARSAAELLRAAPLDNSASEGTSQFAAPREIEEGSTESVLIFRIGTEWLALPTLVVDEVTTPAPMHSLPHARSSAVLGLTNVRGELLISVSLGRILGLAETAASNPNNGHGTSFSRRLVLRREAVRVVCPVDEVFGIHRFRPRLLKDVPATLAKAAGRFSKKLLPWNGKSVGVLDDQLLFYTVKRSVA